MAKTKAELQSDAEAYHRTLSAMRAAHRAAQFLDAIKIAMEACEYIDGMMQFERRFEKRTDRHSVETIDYVLQYAPLVFDHQSLETLAVVLKSQRRIDKNTTAELVEGLQNAYELMWDAHRLWSLLEQAQELDQSTLRARLGGDQERWQRIAESWDHMSLIDRIPERGSYRLSLQSRITRETRAKCRRCGAIVKAAMGQFLEENACPKCKAPSTFVILATSPSSTK